MADVTTPHFKIVQTTKSGGELDLAAVPFQWENDGMVLWPTRSNENVMSSLMNPASLPGKGFKPHKCVVKRQNILTWEQAQSMIDVMEQHSDTAASSASECDAAKEMMPPPKQTRTSIKSRPLRSFTTKIPINADSDRNNYNTAVSVFI